MCPWSPFIVKGSGAMIWDEIHSVFDIRPLRCTLDHSNALLNGLTRLNFVREHTVSLCLLAGHKSGPKHEHPQIVKFVVKSTIASSTSPHFEMKVYPFPKQPEVPSSLLSAQLLERVFSIWNLCQRKISSSSLQLMTLNKDVFRLSSFTGFRFGKQGASRRAESRNIQGLWAYVWIDQSIWERVTSIWGNKTSPSAPSKLEDWPNTVGRFWTFVSHSSNSITKFLAVTPGPSTFKLYCGSSIADR